jgi:hypothetical protein
MIIATPDQQPAAAERPGAPTHPLERPPGGRN